MTHRVSNYAITALIFLFFFAFNHEEAISATLPTNPPHYSEVTGKLSATVLKPVKIVIPSARVNADIIDIGITKTNNLDVPPNYYQAGWYKYGILPGNPGN